MYICNHNINETIMILMLTDIVRVMDPWLTSGIEEDLGLSVKRH